MRKKQRSISRIFIKSSNPIRQIRPTSGINGYFTGPLGGFRVAPPPPVRSAGGFRVGPPVHGSRMSMSNLYKTVGETRKTGSLAIILLLNGIK